MNMHTRRKFFRTAGAGLAGLAVMPGTGMAAGSPAFTNKSQDVEIGIASWGLRQLTVDGVIALMNDLQLSKITINDVHLPYDMLPADIERTIIKMRAAGLDPYAAGVIDMATVEDIARAFDYAKIGRFSMIVGVPGLRDLDLVEQKVKAYDIRLAIQNQGPDGRLYPTALDAYDKIRDRDRRMGICLDVPNVARSGIDPVEEIYLVRDRLMDVHLRDNTANNRDGKACRPGQGNLDLPAILKTLREVGYRGIYTVEYEIEESAPLTGTALTVGYIKGILAAI
jgi:inosose dehydratase